MSLSKKKRLVDDELRRKISTRSCVICLSRPVDCSHIRSRGAGGPDTEWNCVPKCRRHHVEFHQLGWSAFCRKYPLFEGLLAELGWKVIGGRLWNEGLLDD